jgi:hypothetical protein
LGPRRHFALIMCAAGAIGVNAMGLALADQASALDVPPARKLARSQGVPLLIVPARPSLSRGETARGEPGSAALTVAVALPGQPSRPSFEPWRDSMTPSASIDPVRFYRLSEVDSPAEPEGDWALDLDALDALGLDRVAFEVLVSDRGVIVSCVLLDGVGLPPDVRAGLEQRLRSTDMRPATLGGTRVASIRHVELYVDSAVAAGPS